MKRMKSFETEFKKYSQKTTLKASERRELHERLLSYMEYHPLKKDSTHVSEVSVPHGIVSEKFVRLTLSPLHIRMVSGFFVFVLILAPFAAERSVPGDVLYLVKTGITETIQGSFAFSPYQKIEFETRLMERRIAEARVLANEGKLTKEVETELAQTVKAHTHAVQSGLAELREQNADEAAIAGIVFNSSLEVQSAVLGAQSTEANHEDIGAIRTIVNEAREAGIFEQGSSSPSFAGLVARVEIETTRAAELFTTVKRSATREEITDIERRLSDIDRLILESKELHATDEAVASADLATTLGLIQKLITFMSNIDVRESVALETLVPVVLSDDERITFLRKKEEEIKQKRDNIATRVDFVSITSIAEKAVVGIADVDDALLKIHVHIEAEDFDVAESFAHNAELILNDLEILTLPFINDVPEDLLDAVGTSTEEVATTTEEVVEE